MALRMILQGEESPNSGIEIQAGNLELRKIYEVTEQSRDLHKKTAVDLEPDELIELVYDDDTTWLCDASTIRELAPEWQDRSIEGKDTLVLPLSLSDESAQRGILDKIFLKTVRIFTRKAIDKTIAKLAGELEDKQLNNQTGLFQLTPSFGLVKPDLSVPGRQYLLFVHGTNSSTSGSFGKLAGTEAWQFMQSQYTDRILAFEHRTLTESPLKNTQDLVSALPDDCSIDLITTSRGGLVGDILSRFFHSDSAEKGFTSKEIEALKAENRIEDINAIRDTVKMLAKKNIRISRYIRVACPAAGTTLASRRMDHFFNTTLNLLGLATGWMANPVYTAFRNLVSAVLKSKNDVNLLPGLEAMNPDSPFIKILNTPPVTGGYPRVNIDNHLHVISGYCVHQFRLKGLLIIASKLFFRKRNDLVVNTASMYKGTNRLKKVFFFADSQRETDHFSYFENPDTRLAIVQVLTTEPGAAIPGFKLISEMSQAELDRQALLNLEGGEYSEGSVSGKKPIVILLPGIMGSSLQKDGQRIWINYFKFITGALPQLDMDESGIKATGLVRTSYASLGAFLKNENFDVVTFAYDWRLPLTESAARFNEEVQQLLVHKQPIKIMAHSMGGVLVRDFMLGHPDTWKGLSQSDGFKLIFLGSPLGGSFRIPYVLFGKDSIIKTLGRVDLLNSRKKLLGIFSRFQGLLNLMPIDPEQGHDFGDQAHWNTLKAVFGDDKWPIPKPTDLGDFKKYRDNILARQDTIDYKNIVYVAGQDTSTPAGIRIEEDGGSRSMVFLHTAEGDQSVTWDSGIPKALVESNQVYYVPVTHGKLSNEPSLFKGFLEILQTGSTRQFSTKRPVVPATQKLFRGIEDDEFNISPSDVEQSLLGLTTEEMIQESNPPLSVSVVHGDLRFSNYPVLLGHFKNDGILQAEKAVDSLLGGELAKRHRLGLYPGDIGQHVLILPQQGEFKGSLVAGLGTPDKVTAFQLSQSVEKSLTYYLLQLNGNEQSGKFSGDAKFGISSLLLCSGYGGISIENSVRAIVLAARKANENILKSHGDAPKLLECIEFIELYHDKALTCFRALKKLENENDISLRIAVDPVYLKKRPGRSKRLLYNDTAEWWTRVTVEYRKPDQGSADPGNDAMVLNFSMSTSGAREEKRTLLHNRKVIDSLFGMLSSSKQYSTDLAKTIFELIIPNDFKEDLKKQKNILWILDKTTAGYPWEMLQDAVHNAHPLSVSAKMIRQLATMDYSTQINQIANNNALVIADPLLQGYAPQLPGALAEGKITCESLEAEGYSVRFLPNAKSEDIIVALYSNEYKIVHLAGHGMFNPDTPIESGMVIGNKMYLTTQMVKQMNNAPELVFVNCCHLGKTDGEKEELYQNRHRFAANIGTQLIDNGAKAVVVAGWAVDDAAAKEFASVFYNRMFAGEYFGTAVLAARREIYRKHGNVNTWGAYQCYGDQFYTLNGGQVEKQKKPDLQDYISEDEVLVDLVNLESKFDLVSDTATLEGELMRIIRSARLKNLIDEKCLQQIASIFYGLGHYDRSLEYYVELFKQGRSDYPFTSVEQYCIIRAKKTAADYQARKMEASAAMDAYDGVIRDVSVLLNLGETAERYCICGATHKRRTLVKNPPLKKLAIFKEALSCFRNAEKFNANQLQAYIAFNCVEIEFIMYLLSRQAGKAKGKKAGTVPDYTRKKLKQAEAALKKMDLLINRESAENMEFWHLSGRANIELCLFIIRYYFDQNDRDFSRVQQSYSTIWNYGGAPQKRKAESEHLVFLQEAMRTAAAADVKNKEYAEAVCEYLEKLRLMLQ